MLKGLGAGWTGSFLTIFYPALSRYLIREFITEITELSTVVVLQLFVTFGVENFVKGRAVFLTEDIQNLRTRLDESCLAEAIS